MEGRWNGGEGMWLGM